MIFFYMMRLFSISLQKNTLKLRNFPFEKKTQNVQIENVLIENNVQICIQLFNFYKTLNE